MPAIHLNKLKFFAYHGIHPEEQRLGTNFEVNVDITFDQLEPIRKINQTIDYTRVYAMVKNRMMIPTALLETVAREMVDEIMEADARIVEVVVKITKINPPISNFSGQVGVSLVGKRQ